MTNCELSLFSSDLFSEDINFGNLFESFDKLKESLTAWLNSDLPFRTKTDLTDVEYESSIDNLTEAVISKILRLNFELDESKQSVIRLLIRLELLPNNNNNLVSDTTSDSETIPIIAGSDLISSEDRESMTFSLTVREIYGNESFSLLNNFRLEQFNNRLVISTIIVVGPTKLKSKLITSELDLNLGIIQYLEEQYLILRLYLTDLGYDLDLYKIPKHLYYNTAKYANYTKSWDKILDLMYSVILLKKEANILELELDEGFVSMSLNNNTLSLYTATNAYINLAYFDDSLREALGEYILINGNLDAPIYVYTDESGIILQSFKYSFAKGNAFATKTWGIEEHDALKEMAKFSQILIRSIPIYDYNIESVSESESFGKMQVKDFVNTMSKLLDLSAQISNKNPKLSGAITNIKDLRNSLKTIFEEIFGPNNKSIINFLAKNGFDLNYINYLYSIYRTVFKGSPKLQSWDAIELFYIKENGISTTYPIIDTLFGIINSNVANNFLETIYDYNNLKMVTRTKKKYNDRSTKFDVIDNVNWRTIDRDLKSDLLDEFKISKDRRIYTLTLNVQGELKTFTFNPEENTDILDKGIKSNITIQGTSFDISELNLNDVNYRRKLIEKQNLNKNEATIMSMLHFIDTMLDTNFTRDLDGLRELLIMLNLDENNFLEMFLSAVRALVVTDIYNQFLNASKEDGSKYARNEIIDFLSKNKGIYFDNIQDRDAKDKKLYFITRYDGEQLITVYYNLKWLDNYALMKAILSGETSKSVISNLDGDKIPNFSPLFLGARIELQLVLLKDSGGASRYLLFAQKSTAIKSKVINTDILLPDGTRKLIKNMTVSELMYDSFINKFLLPLMDEGIIYTLPTTYADKTKFIMYGVSLSDLKLNLITDPNFNTLVEKQIKYTIGNYYKDILLNVLNDYAKLFPDLMGSPNENGTWRSDSIAKLLSKLNTLSMEELFKLVDMYNSLNNTNLVLYRDLHFREIKKDGKNVVSFNELLFDYGTFAYTSKILSERLLKEKINFINDLLKHQVSFNIERNTSDYQQLRKKVDNPNIITKALIEYLGNNAINWVSGNRMVLAKIRNSKTGESRNITFGKVELLENEILEINPLINAYFMLDNLIGNNLRYSLTGSEINHKVGMLSKMDLKANLYASIIKKFNPNYTGGTITFIDILIALYNIDNSSNIAFTLEELLLIRNLRNLYKDAIYKVESAAQGVQLKRNVIIPGTMRPYTPNCIDGIGSKIKVAVIEDVIADVFNFDGKLEKIKAHDGAALESPILSILENKSLLDNEVGTVKKPIHHWYDDRYGTATLLKYAIDTITNLWMRQAEGNTGKGINLYNLFKKMHNIRWNGSVDLLNSCLFKNNTLIDFLTDILLGHSLFYKKIKWNESLQLNIEQDILIIGFGLEEGIYYTEEIDVDPTGNKINGTESRKVYHYFDNVTSQHITSEELLNIPSLHTIDSLFELHSALGSIYCESLDSEGNLVYSEASNIAVANWTNIVAIKKNQTAKLKNLSVDLNNFYLPLKEAMIGIVANNTAIKNGAGNVNLSSVYYDTTPLRYIEIGTLLYGIQQDSDHVADEGKMTEFSQVISSLDAGGGYHDYVSQIYEALGLVALEMSAIELDAVEDFHTTGNKSKLYDIIGRTIINNLARGRGTAGLADAIIDKIQKKFNLNTDHRLDTIKLPFSDPNIYSTLLSTVTSIINKKSIKRLYPGQGTVMMPGYDMAMIYDINGRIYLFEDLLRIATREGFKSEVADLIGYNRDIVKQLLESRQALLVATSVIISGIEDLTGELRKAVEEFLPTDNILVIIDGKRVHVSLSNILDYYAFKDNPLQYLNNLGYTSITLLLFQKDVLVPRNLAPAKISWQYTDSAGIVHSMNIFDHWRVKNLFLERSKIENSLKAKLWKKDRIKEIEEKYNPQKAFEELEQDKYVDENNNTYSISNLKNEAAELIISCIYKSKFGLKDNTSLLEVLERGPQAKSATIISSTTYDLVFTKLNGKHLYVSFKPLYESELVTPKYRRWSNIVRREVKHNNNTENIKVINEVFAVTSDNIELFLVGREILVDNVIWDEEKKCFTDRDGNILKHQSKYRRYGTDLVLEYVEFLSLYIVQETIGDKLIKNKVYHINKSNLKKVFNERDYTTDELTRKDKDGNTFMITKEQKFDEELNDFISRKILANIYKSSNFDGVLVNSHVSEQSHNIIKGTLYRFGQSIKYNPELSNFIINDLLPIINNAKPVDKKGVSYKKMNSAIRNYRERIAKKQYSSFLRSLSFVASRIPAQTLLSFMLMKCVGFTGNVNNYCFVSHWQTWLQGSDY